MCYQTKITKKREKLEEHFNAKLIDLEDYIPNDIFKAFEFPKTPIITNKEPNLIRMYQWGLIPHWADMNWNRNYTLNARIETLDKKRSFQDIVENRCLIIVNGFYEWQHVNNAKIKYEIGFNDKLFALAGLFDQYESVKSYTIVTTEAKGIMQKIHNTKLRMPFALQNKQEMNEWLNGELVQPNYSFTTTPDLYQQHTLF